MFDCSLDLIYKAYPYIFYRVVILHITPHDMSLFFSLQEASVQGLPNGSDWLTDKIPLHPLTDTLLVCLFIETSEIDFAFT